MVGWGFFIASWLTGLVLLCFGLLWFGLGFVVALLALVVFCCVVLCCVLLCCIFFYSHSGFFSHPVSFIQGWVKRKTKLVAESPEMRLHGEIR